MYNDSGLNLHGRASRRRHSGSVRTLLRPGLDLFCPHLPLSDHLPRPAEEERVRGEEEQGRAWDRIPSFDLGNERTGFVSKFGEKKLQLGGEKKWNNVQLLTRAICLYFEYYKLKWKPGLHYMKG